MLLNCFHKDEFSSSMTTVPCSFPFTSLGTGGASMRWGAALTAISHVVGKSGRCDGVSRSVIQNEPPISASTHTMIVLRYTTATPEIHIS